MFQAGYIGGKAGAGVFHRIIGEMPPHSVYVEPFFGSGAVYYHKRPAAKSILIDRHADPIARIDAAAGVNAICGDALEILPELALPADALIYADPPYVLSSRRQQGRFYYAHEFSDRDHCRLLAILREMPCRVLLSGYYSDLYAKTLSAWRCVQFTARTRGATATEFLWANFPETSDLHDWRYAGRTFRERLTFRRLAARWLARLQDMPARKRGYVLAALAAGRADFDNDLQNEAPKMTLQDPVAINVELGADRSISA